jgi:hypothetical protein
MIRNISGPTTPAKKDEVAYWGIRCACGGVIPLKVVTGTSDQPPINHSSSISAFCTKCGTIEFSPSEVRKCHGLLPEDYWPRLDLFESF